MTVFNFTPLVNDPLADTVSAALGVNAAGKFVEADIGKAVVIAANNNYVAAVKDNEIEGIVVALSPETVNDGFSFGSVQRNGRFVVAVGASVGAAPVVPGDPVVCDTPIALGTAGLLQVYQGTPSTYIWRCVRNITSAGAAGATAGDTILIERV